MPAVHRLVRFCLYSLYIVLQPQSHPTTPLAAPCVPGRRSRTDWAILQVHIDRAHAGNHTHTRALLIVAAGAVLWLGRGPWLVGHSSASQPPISLCWPYPCIASAFAEPKLEAAQAAAHAMAVDRIWSQSRPFSHPGSLLCVVTWRWLLEGLFGAWAGWRRSVTLLTRIGLFLIRCCPLWISKRCRRGRKNKTLQLRLGAHLL